VLLALTVLLGATGATRAELVQKGNLRVAVSGHLSPKHLPRTGAAPIAVTVRSGIATLDGSLPPQLQKLRIEINSHGRLEIRGLPECRIGQIQPASTARALSACRPALVGKGSFSVDAVLGSQEPYPTKGRLLIFNGTYKGHHALLGQIYSPHPFANSFVIPFQVSRLKDGPYGIALTARLPRAFTNWGYVTGLEMRLGRRYSYRGHPQSFISAGCPAPEGFPSAVFPLARTTFAFADGTKLSLPLIGDCKVRSATRS
jgi:hypothetical protein